MHWRDAEVGGKAVHDLAHGGEALGFLEELAAQRSRLLIEGERGDENGNGDDDGEDDFEQCEGGGTRNAECAGVREDTRNKEAL